MRKSEKRKDVDVVEERETACRRKEGVKQRQERKPAVGQSYGMTIEGEGGQLGAPK